MGSVLTYGGADPSESVAVNWPAARFVATKIFNVRVVVSAGTVKPKPWLRVLRSGRAVEAAGRRCAGGRLRRPMGGLPK